MSHHVGILAYGSLISDPGAEISSVTARRIRNVRTPFRVEYARKSRKRDYPPTVVPVAEGGAQVRAEIPVLDDEVAVEKAEHSYGGGRPATLEPVGPTESRTTQG